MEIRKTITSIFMVPTLKIPKDCLKDNGFINGYVKDEMRDADYKDCIFLLFKPENLDKFRDFLDSEYERTQDIIEDYDYEDGYVVVVYQLNTKLKSDFMLIKAGRYSKTSKTFQDLFPKAVKIKVEGRHRDEISLQIRIFRKAQELREFWEDKIGVYFDDEQEVWNGWDEENEILNIEKIKQYV